MLLKRGIILAFLIILIFFLSRYGPQPSFVLEEFGELEEFYSNRGRIGRFLTSLGPYSSAVFLLLQAAQVVVSPIPGEFTGVVGGYVYGTGFGFLLSTLGLTLGSWMAFELARILGRPFVERFVSVRIRDKFRFLTTNAGTAACFLFFAFPGFPKDALCYILGVSRMNLATFLFVSSIGRMPGTYLLTVQGASIQSQDYSMAVAIVVISTVILFAAYLYRAYLFQWVKSLKH